MVQRDDTGAARRTHASPPPTHTHTHHRTRALPRKCTPCQHAARSYEVPTACARGGSMLPAVLARLPDHACVPACPCVTLALTLQKDRKKTARELIPMILGRKYVSPRLSSTEQRAGASRAPLFARARAPRVVFGAAPSTVLGWLGARSSPSPSPPHSRGYRVAPQHTRRRAPPRRSSDRGFALA